MTRSIWTPLDRERRQIRLAHLAPSGKFEDQPFCTIRIASLDDDLQYEALSYVWGDPEFTRPIEIQSLYLDSTIHVESGKLRAGDLHSATDRSSANVDSKFQPLQWPVRSNLETALRYLRKEDVERVLWIDALCIDQSNTEEKNHQVPLMKAIFASADTVRVWLGESYPGSDDAIAILSELGLGTPLQDIRLHGRLIDNEDLRSLIRLLINPWWDRTWVQQELILARRAILHCGFRSLEWKTLLSLNQGVDFLRPAMESLRFDDVVLDDFVDSFDSLDRIERTIDYYQDYSGSTDEENIFILANARLCYESDDRDSIYGFLGLMGDRIAAKIKPNYNLSTAEVFKDAAVQLTLCANSLALFSLTEYTASKNRVLPTWVPNWQTLVGSEARDHWSYRILRFDRQVNFKACGERKIEFKTSGRDILEVSGAVLDRVKRKGDVALFNSTMEKAIEQDSRWRILADFDTDSQRAYIAGGTVYEAYWRTLMSDLYLDIKGPRRRCQDTDHTAYLDWLNELQNTDTVYWESELANSFNTSFTQACSGRRFFVTEKGYFGIGPAELEDGDEIYILAGGRYPYALRPLSAPRSHIHELVGDCYVHGVMNGQAVSGSDSEEDSNRDRLLDADLPLSDFHKIFLQ